MTSVSENADIAVLQTQMKTVLDSNIRIEAKLDTINNLYVLRTEFIAFKKQYWLSHSMTAVLTALITALAYWFIAVRH